MFLLLHHSAPQDALHGPKMAPRRPQDGPKSPQDSHKRRQDGPKMVQDGPKTTPRRPQVASKSPPSRFQVAFKKRIVSRGPPRHAQEVPRDPKMPPKGPQELQGSPQEASKSLPGGPQEAPRAIFGPSSTQLRPQIAEGGGGGHSPPGVLDNICFYTTSDGKALGPKPSIHKGIIIHKGPSAKNTCFHTRSAALSSGRAPLLLMASLYTSSKVMR